VPLIVQYYPRVTKPEDNYFTRRCYWTNLEAFESSPHPNVIIFQDTFSLIHTYISQIISSLHSLHLKLCTQTFYSPSQHHWLYDCMTLIQFDKGKFMNFLIFSKSKYLSLCKQTSGSSSGQKLRGGNCQTLQEFSLVITNSPYILSRFWPQVYQL
jgi:hypothetical protein